LYYPILREDLKVKKHLEIIKGFVLSLLLLLLVSAVAVSEKECEISVTVVESSSDENGNAKTVITTYDTESVTQTIEISESGTSVIPDEEDAATADGDTTPTTSEGDTTPAESPDSDVVPTDFQPDELTYDDEWVEWILSMIDADPFVMFGDFPELDAMANFE
jgi:hypothetical protein